MEVFELLSEYLFFIYTYTPQRQHLFENHQPMENASWLPISADQPPLVSILPTHKVRFSPDSRRYDGVPGFSSPIQVDEVL